jgi:hypothetical protein
VSSTRRLLAVVTLGLLLATCAACTEDDTKLTENVGVARLILVEAGLDNQTLDAEDERIQVAEWESDRAILDVAGALLDPYYDEACSYKQTVWIAPFAEGSCASGIVIESDDDPFRINVVLSLTLARVRRAEPLDLPANEDYDGDGVKNHADNCPLVSNSDQKDDNGDGDGNLCTIDDEFFGASLDSDADGVPDSSDNCVWFPNPDQEDTKGLGAEGIPDGIGDACDEQVAEVRVLDGSPVVLRLGPEQLLQPLGVTTYVTVDFDNALTCNWEAASCTLDPDKVELCTYTSRINALAGC